MALLQIRVDDDLACRAREVARGMGLELSSAVRLFLRQMVAKTAFPSALHVIPSTPKAIWMPSSTLLPLEAGNVVSHEELERRQRF